jgi:hypothetical protein
VFIAPTPNCGHGGRTFSYYRIGELWLCPACFASIGGLLELVAVCSHCCRRPPARGEQLTNVFRAGRLCSTCRRDHRAAARD